MANVRKRILELTALESASLNTTIVGVDGGTTYKIELDTLADAVTARVNILDRDRLQSLESVTSSFETKGRSVVSSSAQITAFGFISSSTSIPIGTISSSTQISDFGFVSTSVDISALNSFTQSFSSSQNILNTAFINGITARLQTSSFNEYTASQSTSSLVDRLNTIESVSGSWITESETGSFLTSLSGAISSSSQLTSSFDQRYVLSGSITQTTWDNIANKPSDIVSSSTQISNLGFVTGSYTTINSFNSLTQSFNSISQSFNVISGSVVNIQGGFDTGSYQTFTSSVNTSISNLNTFTASQSTSSLVNRLNAIENVSGSWITESETGSFLTSLNGAISSSSQLTSSYDTRYTLSGSVQPLPSNLVSSSAQITAFGFISSSTTIDTGSFATTGSNSFNGNQNITGSLVVSAVAVVAGALTIPSASVISLTSGSSISVDSSGAITGSLTGSVFGIGDVVAFSASLNSRIISGSAVAGTISGSSQLTSSYDSRYSLSGSVLTSFSSSVDSRFDTLEATIISGSPNYTQVLGNQRTGITSIGVSIISGSITTTGNPVQIMVTGDANPIGGASYTRLQLFRDGNGIGGIVHVENYANLNVPYCVNVIDTPSAGTYTYSMRTVGTFGGTFDFGEASGPLLTAVELKTNTNLPSTNNTFTGTNRFNGQVTLGGASGDEGGELQLAIAQTNTTLTGSIVSVDIYQDRLRIFEAGGNARGVHIDLSKTPSGNAGELMWKASGFVNAGTFVTLDNLKCTVTTSGQRGLSIGAVSTSFEADLSGWYGGASVGNAGSSANNITYTTTASTSLFDWGFPAHGNTAQYHIRDKTNNRFYRVTMMIGASYNNNFISIERLF